MLSITISAQKDEQTPAYQNLLPDFNRVSPETPTMEKYGSYGMTEYTGTPDIQIPLYSVKSGEVECPMSLIYDATGIKVSQEATCVGLGWNINCGGYINHIVNGKDDFRAQRSLSGKTDKVFRDSINSIISAVQNQAIYYNPSLQTASYIPTEYYVENYGIEYPATLGKWNGDYDYIRFNWRGDLLRDVYNGYHIPDIFQACFGGKSVSFTVDFETNNITVLNDNATKYKIEVNRTGGMLWPSSIIITDDMGIRYVFNAYDEEGGTTDKYYLDEIIGKNSHDYIKFRYKQFLQDTRYEIFQSNVEIIDDYLPGGSNIDNIIGLHPIIAAKSSGRFETNKVYLSEIETFNEKVMFNYASRKDVNGAKCLDRIFVMSKNGNEMTHQMSLTYGYFNEVRNNEGLNSSLMQGLEEATSNSEAFADKSHKRLKLDELIIDSKQYKFEYNKPNELPYRTSLSQDFWGYYNGMHNKGIFCASPKYRISGNSVDETKYSGEANRYSSENNITIGMLKKIVYPTGGYSEYIFEANHFDDPQWYYYPDCSQGIRVTTDTVLYANAVVLGKNGLSGRNEAQTSFVLEKEQDVEFKLSVNSLDPSKYICGVTIWSPQGLINESYWTKESKPAQTQEFIRHLKPGVYVVTAIAIVEANEPYYNSMSAAQVYFKYKDPSKYKAPYFDGGYSTGGGVRLKEVRNYDKAGLLNGSRYIYSDGKLLVPTVHYDTYTTDVAPNGLIQGGNMTYSYVGSQPAYSYAMTMGNPNVGYSRVIKCEFDKENREICRTILKFNNEGYTMLGQSMFYHINFGKNGLLSSKTILSGVDTIYNIKYEYGTKKYERVLFPKVTPVVAYRDIVDLYPKANVWNYLSKTTERTFVNNKPMEPIITMYSYNDANYKESSVMTLAGDSNPMRKIQYKYPVDSITGGYKTLLSKHCLSNVTSMEEYFGHKQLFLVKGNVINFNSFNGIPQVGNFQMKYSDGTLSTDMEVLNYDDYGHIREYVTKDGIHTTILWSYAGQYPIMEIIGATYQDVIKALGDSTLKTLANASSIEKSTLNLYHNILSNIPNVHITSCLYNPWYKVSMIIAPNGNHTYYDYDMYGKLIGDKDNYGNPLKRYMYNYRK